MRSVRRSLLAASAVGALVTAGLAAGASGASAAAPTGRHRIDRTAPSWVATAHSQGRAAASGRSTFRLYLAPKGGVDALKREAVAVATPGTASYGKFLTAAQYHRTYDATDASVAAVRTWLGANQLRVTGVEATHRYLDVTGSNAAVEKAFATTIARYTHKGESVQTNTTDIAVPDAIAPLVLTVTGLDTETRTMEHKSSPKTPLPPGFRNGRPCSTSYGQVLASKKADYTSPLPKFDGKYLPYAVCGYTGPQLRAAYEANSALDGTGSTVAIVDAYASPTIADDAQRYGTEHGDGGYSGKQLTQVVPSSFTATKACDAPGWYGEETLDVEAVHAMAPGARILYYGSKSCFDDDFVDTLAKVVDQDVADVVTNSWGEVEQGETTQSIAAFEQVFLQGAVQGISTTFSSGDNGDELANTAIKQADFPTSDPYVTSVGGTADAIDAGGSFDFQTGWGTEKYSLSRNSKRWKPLGFLYGAGGGASNLFNKPSYQDGVVPARYGARRSVPDVALDADPTTGFLVGETQQFPSGRLYGEYRIGGTSLASPLFAGMSALRQQGNGGTRLGLQNPAIYQAAGTAAFTDIAGSPPDAGNVRVDFANGLDASDGLLYSVRTFNQDSSLSVAPGYDQVTGVGSPTAAWLTQQ